MGSLVWSIGLISSLNRRDELIVPSWAQGVDQHWYGVGVSCCNSTNALDKGSCLLVAADAEGVGFASKTWIADINIEIARGEKRAGVIAQGDVVVAACVVQKSGRSIGRVAVTGDAFKKRCGASGRILMCIVEETERESSQRKEANCRIVCADGEVKKGVLPFGRVASNSPRPVVVGAVVLAPSAKARSRPVRREILELLF
jgi:hypothetical protein